MWIMKKSTRKRMGCISRLCRRMLVSTQFWPSYPHPPGGGYSFDVCLCLHGACVRSRMRKRCKKRKCDEETPGWGGRGKGKAS